MPIIGRVCAPGIHHSGIKTTTVSDITNIAKLVVTLTQEDGEPHPSYGIDKSRIGASERPLNTGP